MRKSLIFCLLIATVVLVAYSNTFHVPFQFDDSVQIADNEVIRDLDNFFSSPAGYEFNPRRFIGYITFALNYHFGGLDVAGYHVVNLVIHIINGMLVYLLVILIFRTPYFKRQRSEEAGFRGGDEEGLLSSHLTPYSSRFIAFFSALLFVAHPVQTQAVTYIVQRLTSLATMFYLLSVVLYINGRLMTEKARGYGPWVTPLNPPLARGEEKGGVSFIAYCLSPIACYLFSLVFAICAMKTKEMTFTLPAVIVLCEFGFFRATLKKKLIFLIPVLLTLIVIPVSIMGTHKPLGEILSDLSEKTRVQTDIARWDYLMTQFRVITTYIRLIFFPVDQNLDYDYPIYRSLLDPAVMASFVFLATLIGVAVFLFYRSRQEAMGNGQWATPLNPSLARGEEKGGVSPIAAYRLIAFGIFWFFITLAVESSVIPIADVIFEHRIYLPSVGAFIAITTAVFIMAEKLQTRWRSAGKAAIVVLSLLVIVFAGTTYARNKVWQDETSLWEDVVRKSPGKGRGYLNLGYAYYYEKGWADRAIEFIKRGIALTPDDEDAHYNLGVAYEDKGWFDAALHEYRISLSLRPDLKPALFNVAGVYVKMGFIEDAMQVYLQLLELDPSLAEAHNNLGSLYGRKGNNEKAAEHFEAAVRLKPDYIAAHNNLGVAYREMGLWFKAEEHLQAARKLREDASRLEAGGE